MDYVVRAATGEDGEAMLALMPRLAAFRVPASRTPEHLWLDDAKLLQKWLDGHADECLVHVAEGADGSILGLTLVSLRPEHLSHEPSAHLEVIAVAEAVEGKGVARSLLEAAEEDARRHGALTMTLNVFSTNSRARGFYERCGYDGEVIRYIKPIVE